MLLLIVMLNESAAKSPPIGCTSGAGGQPKVGLIHHPFTLGEMAANPEDRSEVGTCRAGGFWFKHFV
jgi:hypothetical protein